MINNLIINFTTIKLNNHFFFITISQNALNNILLNPFHMFQRFFEKTRWYYRSFPFILQLYCCRHDQYWTETGLNYGPAANNKLSMQIFLPKQIYFHPHIGYNGQLLISRSKSEMANIILTISLESHKLPSLKTYNSLLH